MELEENSPHLRDSTAELWRDFIRRDVPAYAGAGGAAIPEPANPHSWAKVYRKLQREAAREAERDAAALEAAMTGLQAAKDARTTTTFARPVAGLLPGTKRRAAADAKLRAKTSGTRGVLQSGGRVKKVTGSAMLDKVRREAGAFKSMAALGGPKKAASTAVRAPRTASVVGPHPAALKKEVNTVASKGTVAEGSPQKDRELPAPRTFTAPKPKVKPPPAGEAKAAEKPMMPMKRKPPDSIFMPAKKRR